MADDCGSTSLRTGNARRVAESDGVVGDLLDDLSIFQGFQELGLLWSGWAVMTLASKLNGSRCRLIIT